MNKQESRELTAEQINTLDNWVDTISYTVMVLLEGGEVKEAFCFYREKVSGNDKQIDT
ncbi:hypothetical protein [Paenibacillus terrae]|uniref:hypothetical protein n=1 Tax=Paenibacillus terrae TaxID=159743 RepID=UPI0016568515|nr:hypothetical protein [Paenibacillus terrae]